MGILNRLVTVVQTGAVTLGLVASGGCAPLARTIADNAEQIRHAMRPTAKNFRAVPKTPHDTPESCCAKIAERLDAVCKGDMLSLTDANINEFNVMRGMAHETAKTMYSFGQWNDQSPRGLTAECSLISP